MKMKRTSMKDNNLLGSYENLELERDARKNRKGQVT